MAAMDRSRFGVSLTTNKRYPLWPTHFMNDLAQLDQGFHKAGPSDRRLRNDLRRYFSMLVQQLTCSLEAECNHRRP